MPKLKAFLHKLNRFNPQASKRNYKIAKIILGSFIVITLIFRVIPNYAQQPDVIQEVQAGQKSNSQESWLSNGFNITAVNAIQTFIAEVPSAEELTSMHQNGQPYIPGGLLGTTTNYIAQTYTPQASGIEYLAQIKDNFLGKPAYAQGIGFQGLSPILPVWKAFRNIVYLLSSVFFIVLGVMIMFRLKINPQTVLTIQNSIPKVVTTLLLVSFSYAIAGLLIDLIYLIQNLTLATLFVSRGKALSDNLITPGLIGQILAPHSTSFANLSGGDLGDMFKLANIAVPSSIIFILGAFIGSLVGGFVAWPIGSIAGAGIGGAIFLLIVLILVAIWIIKFFFGVMKAYVNIIFKIILAPLEIGLGAIPGMKIGFSSWLNGLFANLAIFPISLLFMVIANIIIEETTGAAGLWAPSMVTSNSAILTSPVLSGGLIPIAIGISSLLILSKLPELIPQAIFAIKPSAWESAIGQAAGNIPRNIMGGIGLVHTLTGFSSDVEKIKGGKTKEEPTVNPSSGVRRAVQAQHAGTTRGRTRTPGVDSTPTL